jgi:CheY-like chemotaxis protein
MDEPSRTVDRRGAGGAPRRFRVLHVEDDDVHAEIVRRNLVREVPALELERVADGAEAQERLFGSHDRPQPDLVLLDLKLPKVDGHEILAMLKGHERLKMIPVVVLTTSDQETDVRRAYAEHANSYLVKPVSFPQFRSLLALLKQYWMTWNRAAPPVRAARPAVG